LEKSTLLLLFYRAHRPSICDFREAFSTGISQLASWS
jgi:hypothetical protein